MYNAGKGVEQDHVEAATWFRKSAEAGDVKAQCNLGVAYYNGPFFFDKGKTSERLYGSASAARGSPPHPGH